jgi:hypothetical protein
VRRNRTREEELAPAPDAAAADACEIRGAVAWEEEFESVVTLAAASHREAAAFQPWELAFTVFTVSISLLLSYFVELSLIVFLFCAVASRYYLLKSFFFGDLLSYLTSGAIDVFQLLELGMFSCWMPVDMSS